jgi:hypothetical protein
MKKLINPFVFLVFALFILVSGCVKDQCKSTYKIYVPLYKSVIDIRASIKSGNARPLQNTGKIYVYGNYVFVNEVNKGVHVINNANPASPQNVSFINIPGNVDIAVKDGHLYADSYADLFVLDISNPMNVKTEKFTEHVFPSYQYSRDSSTVLVDYIEKDTTVNCETYRAWNNCFQCRYTAGGVMFSLSNAPSTGQGGSMARFTIVNDYLYAVANFGLHTFNISNGSNPQEVNFHSLPWNIETIFPFNNTLFIGSTSGMFIYSLSNPASPSQLSQFSHMTACDPVIADAQNAYVTLRTGNACQGTTNELDVLNISNLSSPSLLKIYQMGNPHGLAKDGNLLFICDGNNGFKIYNASDPLNLQLIRTITSLEPTDVILQNKTALVIAKDGLYQFDYSNQNNIVQLSKITINK